MAEMYEIAFTEGFHVSDEKILELKKEADLLASFLEKEGLERTIEKENGFIKTSNLVALDKFRKALEDANGEIWIS